VIVTSTEPVPGGAAAVIEVAEVTVTSVAAIEPKSTVSPAVKFVPVNVTTVPPTEGPDDGFSAVAVETGRV
jgi:hypothetical protein